MARPKTRNSTKDGLLKPRRSHRKSRHGCAACKKRHMKCDETQPVCVNCNISDRVSQCIYINIGRKSPPETSSLSGTPSPFDFSSVPPSSTSTPHTADGSTHILSGSSHLISEVGLLRADCGPISSAGSPNAAPLIDMLGRDDLFDLNHLDLYHYLLMNRSVIMLSNPAHENVTDYIFEYALKAPYMMNQLLAIAALYLSKPPLAQQPYHQLSTTLQTRALASFNQVRQEVSDETCFPLFIFTSLVGVHVLCDTLQPPRETSGAVLDRFITYLLIHRGVRTVAKEAWKTLKNSKFGPYFQQVEDALTIPENDTEPSIDILNKMIEANASPSSTDTYRKAISALQRSFTLFKSLKDTSGQQLDAAIAFCLDFDDEYLLLLRQRQPEALVILAFFGVLLHWNRKFWVIGDGGQLLIQAIADSLGRHWAEWLQWPISALEDVS
ncbi:hypothetical protein ACHAQK_002474 [Fusarium lateritium]